ncbi:hypothetical protein FACS189454_05380 [Planctomycetales bacterium]|nr:hypothetical protein FACS189454_05380 [Planctomycetales bacterium]
MSNDIVHLILWSLILLVLIGIFVYTVRAWRAKLVQPELSPHDYLLYFKKLQDDGELTAEEFRIIERILLRNRDEKNKNQHSNTE